jgi:hypothetical protein
VVIRNHSTRASRQIAISTLLAVSGEFDIHTLIFDLDETTYLSDRELIRRYNELRIPNFVHFDFKRRNEEPLLWVADGVDGHLIGVAIGSHESMHSSLSLPVKRETRLTHRPEGCRAHFARLLSSHTKMIQLAQN